MLVWDFDFTIWFFVFRSSLCFYSVDKANVVYKNGSFLKQIKTRRKSQGNLLPMFSQENQKCVRFWSGRISKLCIKGMKLPFFGSYYSNIYHFYWIFRYASLYFCAAVEQSDNELVTLEIIHRYVELLDKYFGSVSFNRSIGKYFVKLIFFCLFRFVSLILSLTLKKPTLCLMSYS